MLIVLAVMGGLVAMLAIAMVLEPHGSFEMLCRLTSPLAGRGGPVVVEQGRAVVRQKSSAPSTSRD